MAGLPEQAAAYIFVTARTAPVSVGVYQRADNRKKQDRSGDDLRYPQDCFRLLIPYQFGGNESNSKWYRQHNLIPPPTGSLLLECCFLLFVVFHGIFPVTAGSTRFRENCTCATPEINLVLLDRTSRSYRDDQDRDASMSPGFRHGRRV